MYLLLLHLLLALLIVRSGLVPQLLARLHGTVAENTHLYDAMMPYHRRMDGSVPDGALVFIGDSIVQALATSAVADKSVNYGIGADTVKGLLARISTYRSIDKARGVVVSIGVNDLWFRPNEEIVSLYRELVNDLPANVPLLINAVFPVVEKNGFPKGTNDRIRALNVSLAEIAAEHVNITFVSNQKQFSDTAGELNRAYHIGDGLHLNTAGYQLWIDILRRQLAQDAVQLQLD